MWILTNRKPVDRRDRVQLIDGSGERFWRSMRKSLGSKRREISDGARAEIVRIYGEYLNGNAGYGDVSKIFPTTDFGYREIRVERPLRLRYEVTDEALIALAQDKATEKLVASERQEMLVALKADLGGEVFMDRVDFDSALTRALRDARLKIGAPVRKAILSHCGTRMKRPRSAGAKRCSIPDDHRDPRRSAFFMARSVLRDIREGVRAC